MIKMKYTKSATDVNKRNWNRKEIKNQTAKNSLSNAHRFLIMQENQKQTFSKITIFELSKNQIDCPKALWISITNYGWQIFDRIIPLYENWINGFVYSAES